MKKSLLTILILTMVLSLALPTTIFAEAANEGETAPIKLSIEEALELLEDSPQMQIVNLQKIADQAAATGASEGLESLKEAEDAIKMLTMMGDPTSLAMASTIESQTKSVSKGDLEDLKRYARKMTEPNDKARRNALRLQATEMYYTLKNTEKLHDIALENYNISKKIYDNTVTKHKLGTVSKVDLLSAELNLSETKDSYLAAKNGLEQVKMGFNLFFGLDLMQPVILTSDIATPDFPTITLDDAIESALNNRNEIKQEEYQFDIAKTEFGLKSAYPRNSATYLGAKAMYIAAETEYLLKPALIEQEVRTNYMNMTQYYDALITSEKSVSNAKETLRLVQLQYDNGLVTLSIVQQAQLGYDAALQSQASAILKYALAVEAFTYSYDVGTVAAAIN